VGRVAVALTPFRQRPEVIVEAMMRNTLEGRIGFAVPQPFVEIATRFAQRAGDIAKGLDLLEDTLQLRICHFLDARHEKDALLQRSTVNGVSIAEEIARRGIPGKRLNDLLGRPDRGWMFGHIDMHDTSALMSQ